MELTKVDEIVERYEGEKSWLVMILQDVQEAYNYLPEPALDRVARKLDVGLSRVYNVATFYSSFSLTERGRHVIRVCDGTACHLKGGPTLRDQVCRELDIDVGGTSGDKMFSLEVVACLGACALAPVMTVGHTYHGQMTVEKLRETLQAYREGPSGATE
ncbi:MAG: NADH-quinone oxidoreductase subunit NuoE family protein [Planctomycetota bacterium]|jgi:NADH-quinone oxidoreductase subunit E